MNARDRHLGWIGLVAGLIGIIVLNVAPLSGLIPLNRVLFALICSLVTILVLVSVTKRWDGEA